MEELNKKIESLSNKVDKLQSTLDWMIQGMHRAQSIRQPFKESSTEAPTNFEINFSKEDKSHLSSESPLSYISPPKYDFR